MGSSTAPSRQRKAVAAAAARLIAEDGLDLASAKAKAIQQVIGVGTPKRDALPDDDEVHEALSEYRRLFEAETHPARIAHLRRVALHVMQTLPQHELVLVGAVASGTAGDHDAIYLQCYVDSSKDLHIDLLNEGIDADPDEVPNPFGRGRVERLTFWFDGETVHITCYPHNRARQIGDQLVARLDRAQVEALLARESGRARPSLLFAVVAVCALVAGVAVGMRNGESPAATRDAAVAARLFEASLNDVLGQPQALSQWRGKPLVVNFWATWCKPCVQEMPELRTIRAAYAARGVEVIGIALDNPSEVRAFLKNIPVDYPILIGGLGGTDLARDVGDASGGLPFTLVLDARGAVAATKLGRIDATSVRATLDTLTSGH